MYWAKDLLTFLPMDNPFGPMLTRRGGFVWSQSGKARLTDSKLLKEHLCLSFSGLLARKYRQDFSYRFQIVPTLRLVELIVRRNDVADYVHCQTFLPSIFLTFVRYHHGNY
jgi:hypothetical protein